MIDGIAVLSRQPYLLLVPTRQWVDSRVESRLGATNGAYFPICDLIHSGDDGQLLVPQTLLQALGAALGVQPGAGPSGNTFQRSGEFWQLSFNGETKFLKDSVGLGYIARLLMEPNRDMPAVTLLAARAGIDPLVTAGSLGGALDDQARDEYGRRYRELQDELHEARQNSDLGQIEKLEGEMEQLANELASATGLGGRSRERTDIEKVRKSVSMAVSRDIERIGKQHETLGRHLTASITSGLTFRYAPEHVMQWLT